VAEFSLLISRGFLQPRETKHQCNFPLEAKPINNPIAAMITNQLIDYVGFSPNRDQRDYKPNPAKTLEPSLAVQNQKQLISVVNSITYNIILG
jgi:hypothetical protein